MNKNIDFKIEFDDKKLQDLKRILENKYSVKVGVLNGGDYKDDKNNITVAGYGAVNEFGSIKRNIPERSFIRAPLLTKLGKSIVENKNYLKDVIDKQGDMKKVYERLGILAKTIIFNAFETSGDGKWELDKPATVKRKKSSKPLIDKARLIKSIDYEVE